MAMGMMMKMAVITIIICTTVMVMMLLITSIFRHDTTKVKCGIDELRSRVPETTC